MAGNDEDKKAYCAGFAVKELDQKKEAPWKDAYIYLKNGDFIGAIYIDKQLPEKLEINGVIYEKKGKMNLTKQEEKKRRFYE